MSNNEISIGDAIRAVLKEHNLQEAFDQASVVNLWQKVVGQTINQHTTDISFKKGVLYVKIDNAGLRHELSLARDKLREQLNLVMQSDIVQKVVLV